MSFDLIRPFKHIVWQKIQEDIRKNRIPSSAQFNIIDNFQRIVSASWEISKNALTSDLDISVFIDGLPEDDSKKNTPIIGVQISIPSQINCSVESSDISIANWGAALDDEYDSLPEKIQQLWNQDTHS